jgi:hypothetical protein
MKFEKISRVDFPVFVLIEYSKNANSPSPRTLIIKIKKDGLHIEFGDFILEFEMKLKEVNNWLNKLSDNIVLTPNKSHNPILLKPRFLKP